MASLDLTIMLGSPSFYFEGGLYYHRPMCEDPIARVSADPHLHQLSDEPHYEVSWAVGDCLAATPELAFAEIEQFADQTLETLEKYDTPLPNEVRIEHVAQAYSGVYVVQREGEYRLERFMSRPAPKDVVDHAVACFEQVLRR